MRDEPLTPCPTFADDLFAGCSLAMERLRLQLARIAPHFRIALVTGEPGSGKQALALALHKLSSHPEGPFVTRPAAAFADDRLDLVPDKLASTLYLHNVEELSPVQQEQLLARLNASRAPGPRRALDARAVVDRVVVGSNTDLRGLVAIGRISPEFFQRIGTLELRLPPLRERMEDLPAIADGMLRQSKARCRFSPAAIATLQAHSWPGNLTELRSFLAQLRELEGTVEPRHLPPFAAASHETGTLRLDDVMQRHVAEVLQRCAGNKLRAAELLGISRSTLYRMLEQMAA